MDKDLEKLKYPIGKFILPNVIEAAQITVWIDIIKHFPARLKNEVEALSEKELEKTYRLGVWTIKQIVHHCSDSHMNSLIRFKLALTENTPVIKPYREGLWAELSDAKHYPITGSIKLLEGLHERWVNLLVSLSSTELDKQFIHPESGETISLRGNIGMYAWHCNHHLAHIINAKQN